MKYPEIKNISRKLRHNTTPSEQILWRYIRKRQLCGKKFLRQHAIIYQTIGKEHFFFVPDFYCYEAKLAIELDGKIHEYQQGKDQIRDEILNDMGIKVFRIKNEELRDMESVLKRIKMALMRG